MKQIFGEKIFNNFKKYFKIKEEYSKEEKKYFDKAYKYIKYIKWIPGIKMIGIGNSLAMKSATESSDIDLYIVTDKNAMWFVRIFVTFIFQIFGVRKDEKNHAGRFCLSFFSTIDGMDFGKFKIENDIYLYFRIVYFKPILDYNETYKKFLEINSNWANFDDYKDIIEENKKFIKYKKNKKWSNIFFVGFFDKILKKIFLPKTLNHFERIGKPYGVIINDDLLKFHNGDIRQEISKKLNNYF
ncbi:hypothetical protein D8B46_09420 [Candidatus Gracilibacteria bacterium]|nr:MAG: hypothetical protein D8B46_09420 [Candidatus Gracilibacteria bacterium]